MYAEGTSVVLVQYKDDIFSYLSEQSRIISIDVCYLIYYTDFAAKIMSDDLRFSIARVDFT